MATGQVIDILIRMPDGAVKSLKSLPNGVTILQVGMQSVVDRNLLIKV